MPDLFDEYGIEDVSTTTQPVEDTPDLFDKFGVELQPRTPAPQIPKVADLPEDSQKMVEERLSSTEQLAKAMFADEEIEAIKAKGKIGFFEAKNFLDYEDVLPGGGIYQGVEAYQLIKAAEKMQKGEETTIGEDGLIRKFVRETIEKDLRGFSVPGGIAYGGAQLPAFLIEFAATGGVGKAAQEGVEAAAKKGIQQVVKKSVTKSTAAKAAGVTANITARTALMPARYTASYGEQRLNNFVSVTDKGSVIFKEGDESPAKSALKAFAYTGIETASEMFGAAIGKYAVAPTARYLKTPIAEGIAKLPTKLRMDLYQAYKAVQPNAAVSKVFAATGWNGMLEELGEERVADIMRATFDISVDKDYTFDDYMGAITPSKDQLMIEAGIISIMGGIKGSADATVNILQNRGMSKVAAEEAVANMTETERDNLINEATAPQKAGEQLELPLDSLAAEDPVRVNETPVIDDSESVFQEAYRVLVNDIQPLENLEKKADGLSELDKPSTFARAYRGVMSNISYNLKYGTTRYNPETGTQEVTGKSYQNILDDVDATLATIEGDKNARRKDFDDYRIAMSILDDVKLMETDDRVQVPQSQIDMANENLNRLQEKYGDEYQFIEEFGRESTEYSQRILQNLVDSGILSQDKYNELVEKRPNFTSLQRVLEDRDVQSILDSNPLFSDVRAGNVLKFRKGSERDIKNVNETIIRNTASILDAASRNRVGAALSNMADMFPESIQKAKHPTRGTITVRKDGREEYYKVSKPLLKVMEGMSPVEMGTFEKFAGGLFRIPASLLRFGATSTPEFIARSIAREAHGAVITTQGKASLIDTVKGYAHIIGNSELYKEWQAQGGAFNSHMELNDKGIQKVYKELLNDEINMVKKANPFYIINQVNSVVEAAPRVGLYAKLRSDNMTGIEAVLASRDLMDYSRGGAITRKLNRYVPFLNAGVQGADRAVRAFKEHPKQTAAWAIATITVPSVLITSYYLYGADDETREEYLNIPQYIKDLHWVFKENGEWRRIPKPFNYGYAFGSMPERFMVWAYKGDKPEMKKFALDTLNGAVGSMAPISDAPSLLPLVVKVGVENATNHNFFHGRSIYPEYLEGAVMEKDKDTKYTSETAKIIGDKLNVSPALIDNNVRAFLGGTGTYALDASDKIVRGFNKAKGTPLPEKPSRASMDIPVLKGFSVDAPYGTRSNDVINFYDNWQELKEINGSYGKRTGEEKREFLDKHQESIRTYQVVRKSYYKRIITLNKQADAIRQDVNITSDEKLKEMLEIAKEVTDIAKEANEYIKDNKKE